MSDLLTSEKIWEQMSKVSDGVMSKVKYMGGPLTKGLCCSCRHGHIYRYENMNDPVSYCESLSKEVHNNISVCTAYSDKTQVSLYTMADQAIIIDPYNEPVKAGFKVGDKQDDFKKHD